MTVASDGSVWIADGASLLHLNPRTGTITKIRPPIARFPAGHGRTAEYDAAAGVIAAGPHGQIWFTDGNGVLGELYGGHRFAYWRIPAGATAGLAVLPRHGVYISYSSPAMIVVHR
jgi:streptogramin lyase